MLSVISSLTPIVFCEGIKDGLDTVFLHQIIPPGQAQIKPVGGKEAMRAFIEGHIAGYTSPPKYLGFRDRDFDVEPPDTPQLIALHGPKPIWMTYRACLESYFIDADLLHQYWSGSATGPAWKYGPSPLKATFETIIEQSARQLAEYQAVRWALSKLKPGHRWPTIRATWMRRGSGHLPKSLAFDDCLAEASDLVDNFKKEVAPVDKTRLKEEADHFRQRFAEDYFYTQRKFLVWFHGKDLLSQLFRGLNLHLQAQGLPSNISAKHYQNSSFGAVRHLNSHHHPDLQELITKLS